MKKIIAGLTTVFLIVVFSSTPARADRKTMEGFLLGAGITILGAAIYDEMQNDSPRYNKRDNRRQAYKAGYKKGYKTSKYKKHQRHHRRGHWEIDKVWVDPVYETKWNPGHYSRDGEWVNGRYEKFLVSNGYWKERKIWVRY